MQKPREDVYMKNGRQSRQAYRDQPEASLEKHEVDARCGQGGGLVWLGMTVEGAVRLRDIAFRSEQKTFRQQQLRRAMFILMTFSTTNLYRDAAAKNINVLVMREGGVERRMDSRQKNLTRYMLLTKSKPSIG